MSLKQFSELDLIYKNQINFQRDINNLNDENIMLPTDDPKKLHLHLTSAMVEIAEVLQSDKRWKQHTKITEYDKDDKLEEMADVFLFLINALIYSDTNINDFINVVLEKQFKNRERFING